MLRFWAEDKDGFEVAFGLKEYGFNFLNNAGYEPTGVNDVKRRGFDYVIEAGKPTKESFGFSIPADTDIAALNATLTYIFFVTPPPEAKDRLQKGVIARIRAAKTQKEKDEILNVEIPARMNSMNTMESTYPPVVMAKVSRKIDLQTKL
jgi:hypothetical protein